MTEDIYYESPYVLAASDEEPFCFPVTDEFRDGHIWSEPDEKGRICCWACNLLLAPICVGAMN